MKLKLVLAALLAASFGPMAGASATVPRVERVAGLPLCVANRCQRMQEGDGRTLAEATPKAHQEASRTA